MRGLRAPVRARHSELSIISSVDDSPGIVDTALIELALRAGARALNWDLTALGTRSTGASKYLSVFPGEHYKFLASLVDVLRPNVVVEIGTFTGLSALAIMSALPPDSRLITFDLVPWHEFPDTALRQSDFVDGRLEQRIGDLASSEYFARNRALLQAATLVFVDGPKDGRFEPRFTRLLIASARPQACFVVFDDIRLWNMLGFWRDLDIAKCDATSVGHWSGTGICWLPPAK